MPAWLRGGRGRGAHQPEDVSSWADSRLTLASRRAPVFNPAVSSPATPPVDGRGNRIFATTRWTVVLMAGGSTSVGSAAALEQLCRTYWYPLYSFVRGRGLSPHDAEDLIQSFFAFLLEKEVIARADRERGRFRTFLLAALQNFQANERARAGSLKRGGGLVMVSFDELQAEARYRNEPATNLSPERVFDQKWAASLLDQVLQILRQEYTAAGKAALFEALRQLLWGGRGEMSYETLARQLGTTEGAIKVAVHRLRLRYKECLHHEVMHTVAAPGEVEDELRHLLTSLSL
jgi:RNA polymerase sigma factor (sigma-70 family)